MLACQPGVHADRQAAEHSSVGANEQQRHGRPPQKKKKHKWPNHNVRVLFLTFSAAWLEVQSVATR